MEIKSMVRLSKNFMHTLGGYPLYLLPARNETEKVKRLTKRRRRKQELKNISNELSEQLLRQVRQ